MNNEHKDLGTWYDKHTMPSLPREKPDVVPASLVCYFRGKISVNIPINSILYYYTIILFWNNLQDLNKLVHQLKRGN